MQFKFFYIPLFMQVPGVVFHMSCDGSCWGHLVSTQTVHHLKRYVASRCLFIALVGQGSHSVGVS